MYFYFYKTTNILNGKYYYGVHKTDNIDDGYLGSGKAIKQAIQKYGKKNFIKEIIMYFTDACAMYEYEKLVVTVEVVLDENSYNMTIGGVGGFSHIDNFGEKNPMKNPEIARKVVDTKRKSGGYHTEAARKAREHITELARMNNTGKKRPSHSELMKHTSSFNDLWKNKEEFRDILSTWFTVYSHGGIIYETNRLEDFCKEHHLGYTALWNTSRTGKPVSKGMSKGWYCERKNNEL